MNQRIILCGLGRLGGNVLEFLQAAGLNVVVIDQKAAPADAKAVYLRGDIRDRALLEQAGVHEARAVILATSDDLANIAAALQVRSMSPHVRIVIRVFNQNLLARLGKSVHNIFALSVSALTAPALALMAMNGQALGSIVTADDRFQIAELSVTPDSPWNGRTIESFRAKCVCTIVALARRDMPLKLFQDVDPAHSLHPGDRLIVCGEPAGLATVLDLDDKRAPDALRWAGFLRRVARIIGRTLAEIDLAVKIGVSVLLAIVLVSTLVFHFGMNRTLPDGLYATISVLSTGADLGGERLPEGWQKVFVSILRILGVAVMAAFTAIVTNHLLRVRLGGVLELRRIPEAGHIVVCGLGNVGFRITEELIRQGEQVVVVEQNPAGRFVAVARQLGAAVIHGDSTLLQVHRQANSATAKAVVAATNDPLVNLEVALLTRELNPRQRVIVRMADPSLAKTLREAANVRLAFSTTALAAPAFVAAVFGDRVVNIFVIEGRVLAALDFVLEEEDAVLVGATIDAFTRRQHGLALRLWRDGATLPPAGEQTLALGDRLLLILELTHLPGLLARSVALSAEAGRS